MWKRIDLTGKIFGRWTVLGFSHQRHGKRNYWLCRCSCGTEKPVLGASIVSGMSSSCGCLMLELARARDRTHGMHKHPAYSTWHHMRQRCSNPRSKNYPIYGGRGIKVCDRWMTFENFWADMGATWQPGRSIERINVDGHYESGNCRWATPREQANNRRTAHLIATPKGRMSVTDAAHRFGVSRRLIFSRIRQGWPEDHLLDPVQAPAQQTDLIGKRFGRWIVVGIAERGVRRNFDSKWDCRCVCGTARAVREMHLVRGLSKSCGCAKVRDETGVFRSATAH